jgi:hypothetical protein
MIALIYESVSSVQSQGNKLRKKIGTSRLNGFLMISILCKSDFLFHSLGGSRTRSRTSRDYYSCGNRSSVHVIVSVALRFVWWIWILGDVFSVSDVFGRQDDRGPSTGRRTVANFSARRRRRRWRWPQPQPNRPVPVVGKEVAEPSRRRRHVRHSSPDGSDQNYGTERL